MSRITVSVQVGSFPSDRDIVYAVELNPIECEALAPLDFPSASSGIFCTPQYVVERVTRIRRVKANELTRAIMEALAARDTFDGHTPVGDVFGRKGRLVEAAVVIKE